MVAAARYRTVEHGEEDVLRAARGLPLRRRLTSPWKIGAFGTMVTLVLVLTVVVGPALAVPPGQVVQRITRLLGLVMLPVLLGAARTTSQFVRREHEVARALHTDRLAAGLTATHCGR
ncbi:hypothetical protein SAMN05216371_8239 [Streptomyces sp. TLI_053]|uniref:hypothetical protein n=1 Tax=Streptomyces sp. TLI_053 TaxID=1855352 RepID=UPI00087C6B15|nr:hypothetical protein [Streptomyces sp. TLI_053]SDT83412.1 hypothetical protein SAMN05216371_8239 [Streptomyces sp. TLI_053]